MHAFFEAYDLEMNTAPDPSIIRSGSSIKRITAIISVLALAATTLVAGFTSPASATPPRSTSAWGPSTALLTSNTLSNFQVRVSANGTRTVAIWTQQLGSNYYVLSSAGTVNGTSTNWSAPINVGTTNGTSDAPQIALSADGSKILAVWTSKDASPGRRIQARVATLSGNEANWSATTSALSPSDNHSFQPSVAMSSNGSRGLVSWGYVSPSTTNRVIQVVSSTISGNTANWGAPGTLTSDDSMAELPKVKLSADGTKAFGVWIKQLAGVSQVQSRSATVSGITSSWGTTSTLSSGSYQATLAGVDPAFTPNGSRALVTWRQFDGSDFRIRARAATVNGKTSAWGSTNNLSSSGTNAVLPKVSLSSNGSRAIAAWQDQDSNTVQISTAALSGSSASWSAVKNLSSSPSQAPNVALSADGALALVVWIAQVTNGYKVQASTGVVNGKSSTFTTTTVDSRYDGASGLAMASSANATRPTYILHGDKGDGAKAFATSGTAALLKGTQDLRSGTYPKSLKKKGTTTLNKASQTTIQGIALKAKVKITSVKRKKKNGKKLKGKCYVLKTTKNRSVTIKTFKRCTFKVAVTYSAAASSLYNAKSYSKAYKVKK